jgi:hypothetical protein
LLPSKFSGLMDRVMTLRIRAMWRASNGMVARYRQQGGIHRQCGLSLSKTALRMQRGWYR